MNSNFSDNPNDRASHPAGIPNPAGLPIAELTAAELDRERMISRLVDDVASSDDWQRLATVAGTDPTIFADLADTRRQAEQLSGEVMSHVSRADGVGLDTRGFSHVSLEAGAGFASAAAHDASAHELGAPGHLPARWKLGWAVAAALGLLSLSQFVNNNSRISAAGNGGNAAGLMSVGSTEQARDAYYKLGRQDGSVVTEVPQRYVLESRTLPDGRQEVLFLRQVIERAIVSDVYRMGSDETGRPVLVPSAPATSAGPAL